MSEDNPYANRDHENIAPADRSDVMAVASLLGQVTGSLKEIDSRNVGSKNKFTQAVKMDPKQVLTGFINNDQPTTTPTTQPAPQHVTAPMTAQSTIPPPIAQPTMQTQHVNMTEMQELHQRVVELEKIVQSYKRIEKFKRGVSYNVSTTNIKGVYKSPSDILDIVSAEISKQTKTITLKLNDTNKD